MVSRRLLAHAKRLRSSQTVVPLGHYIVDFACLDRGIVVELDGGQHSGQQAYDSARDAWLVSCGFTVLRFTNEVALRDTESVLESIRHALSPSPSPASGRGEE